MLEIILKKKFLFKKRKGSILFYFDLLQCDQESIFEERKLNKRVAFRVRIGGNENLLPGGKRIISRELS